MSTQPKTLGTKVIRGTLWTVGMRWISRFMGIFSMVIIARLLTPVDFGIIAVTTAIIGLMDAFTDLGVDAALIRNPNPLRKNYNTAWTFTIIIHTASAILIALAGFFSTHFYSDPRYELVLYAMSISMLVSGLTNIGVVNFRRTLNYQKDFQLNVSVQIIGVVTTIILAFCLRSYWALVFGGITRTYAKLFLSYIMQTYRPRLSLTAWREMFNFSFWIMVRSIAIFLTDKADRLILAAYFNPATLGMYAISGELASMAVFELLHPLGRALLPALATKQNDQEWLEQSLKKILNITATFAVATGVGLAAVSSPVLTLIYGKQYVDAASMLMWLSLLSAIGGFNQPIGQFLLLMNKARDFALLYMMEGIATLATIYYLSIHHYDFQSILYGRLAIAGLAFLRLFYLLTMLKSINWISILLAWIRPVIAGSTMFFILKITQEYFTTVPLLILLPLLIIIGALVFGSILIIVWILMKKPVGIENEIISRLRKNY